MPELNIPTKEEARARFWELKTAIDAVEAQTAPLRVARDAHVNKARDQDAEMMTEIRGIEAEVIDGKSMFDAKMELAACARLAGGVVGEDPSKA